MCWVMPPASPETTLVLRMASRSEVLPWSTWPMMVTTGGRGSMVSSTSGVSKRPSSTSDSATRFTVWPSSSATSCAVSASIASVILSSWPCFIRRRITSTARSDMRFASSWIVIVSGTMTSRASFSFGSAARLPVRRCMRRRNEASERVRSSSPPVAVAIVSRPRLRLPPGARGVFGGVMIRVGMPGRRMMRLPSASSSAWTGRPGARSPVAAGRAAAGSAADGAGRAMWFRLCGRRASPGAGRGPGGPRAGRGSSPRRRRASSSARRLRSSSLWRRSSSSRLRASAAARSRASRASRSARRFDSSSA